MASTECYDNTDKYAKTLTTYNVRKKAASASGNHQCVALNNDKCLKTDGSTDTINAAGTAAWTTDTDGTCKVKSANDEWCRWSGKSAGKTTLEDCFDKTANCYDAGGANTDGTKKKVWSNTKSAWTAATNPVCVDLSSATKCRNATTGVQEAFTDAAATANAWLSTADQKCTVLKSTECRCTDKTVGTGARTATNTPACKDNLPSCNVMKALTADSCTSVPAANSTIGYKCATDHNCITMKSTECRNADGSIATGARTNSGTNNGCATAGTVAACAAATTTTTTTTTTGTAAKGEGESAAGEGEGEAAAAGAGEGTKASGAIVALLLMVMNLF